MDKIYKGQNRKKLWGISIENEKETQIWFGENVSKQKKTISFHKVLNKSRTEKPRQNITVRNEEGEKLIKDELIMKI